MVGIYKIESPSGRVYIGQSWNIQNRWADYGKKTTKGQPGLFHSFNKYGKKYHIFSIVHELPKDCDQSVLDKYEQVYMDLYRFCGARLMNIREAGSRGKLSQETKDKVSESLKGNIPWNKGVKGIVKLSNESRQKISAALKGKTYPKKIGIKMPDHVRIALSKKNIGSKRTLEQRKKISDATKGRPYHGKNNGKVRTAEVRALHSKIQSDRIDNKGESHNLAKFTTNQILQLRQRNANGESVYSLSKEYGMSYTNAKDIVAKRIWRHI